MDLAGSERQAKTEAVGQRMKEGCAINRSLSALGLVIKELSERHSKPHAKGKDDFVPFRYCNAVFAMF